jgi:hypothetical protein
MPDLVIPVSDGKEMAGVVAAFSPASWERDNEDYCVRLKSTFPTGGERIVILVRITGKPCSFG